MSQGGQQNNIVQGGSNTPSHTDGENVAGGGIELTKFQRKTNPTNARANSGGGFNIQGTLDDEADHQDPAWRAKVDNNIRTLARSLDKLHQKLDQLLPTPDYNPAG